MKHRHLKAFVIAFIIALKPPDSTLDERVNSYMDAFYNVGLLTGFIIGTAAPIVGYWLFRILTS